ncbi:uncharacterized protein A4U43_C03F19600 [Asparagus officinalis]|uniref:Uncharacterized protein n=1 Tax=Asparagus officinalis TaxID=4686 RepID=A0A5P1FBF3_ASPOF|nr:uncharacterized protein A4U43_C03F19600 [Asparagus officinalis]
MDAEEETAEDRQRRKDEAEVSLFPTIRKEGAMHGKMRTVENNIRECNVNFLQRPYDDNIGRQRVEILCE